MKSIEDNTEFINNVLEILIQKYSILSFNQKHAVSTFMKYITKETIEKIINVDNNTNIFHLIIIDFVESIMEEEEEEDKHDHDEDKDKIPFIKQYFQWFNILEFIEWINSQTKIDKDKKEINSFIPLIPIIERTLTEASY